MLDPAASKVAEVTQQAATSAPSSGRSRANWDDGSYPTGQDASSRLAGLAAMIAAGLPLAA
jgi:hypothetical protein